MIIARLLSPEPWSLLPQPSLQGRKEPTQLFNQHLAGGFAARGHLDKPPARCRRHKTPHSVCASTHVAQPLLAVGALPLSINSHSASVTYKSAQPGVAVLLKTNHPANFLMNH